MTNVETDLIERARQAARHFGFRPEYESAELVDFQRGLTGARRFVDVGANRGLYSYLANSILQKCEIILIEADPAVSAGLQEEVRSWPTDNANTITIISNAAGNTSTTLEFTRGADDTVGSFTHSDRGIQGSEIVRVEVHPLDTMIAPQADTVFKIDVEGFEYRVLEGAKTHLKQPRCRLYLEIQGWGDQSIHKYPYHVVSLLRTCGFSIRRVEKSYQYVFDHAPLAKRWLSFLEYGPIFGAKYLIRRTGLRNALHGMWSNLRGNKKSLAATG